MRIHFVVSVCVLLSTTHATAEQKLYETGTVAFIKPMQPSLPIQAPDGRMVQVPVQIGFEVEVTQGDRAIIGARQKKRYDGEWRPGDTVQFRLHGSKLYLKSRDGKDFTLDFVVEGILGSDGNLAKVLRRGH